MALDPGGPDSEPNADGSLTGGVDRFLPFGEFAPHSRDLLGTGAIGREVAVRDPVQVRQGILRTGRH